MDPLAIADEIDLEIKEFGFVTMQTGLDAATALRQLAQPVEATNGND